MSRGIKGGLMMNMSSRGEPPSFDPFTCYMHILRMRRLHVAIVLNGLCCAWRSILLMESKPLLQIQMRCTQLWLVLEKHLSEQQLTEGFLNTRQSQCLTQRRGERCARTAEWKTGQRLMMVISGKPKQSHPLIPYSLSFHTALFGLISLTPKSSNTYPPPPTSLCIMHTTYWQGLFFHCAWATI